MPNTPQVSWSVREIWREENKKKPVAMRTVQKWVQMGLFPGAVCKERTWFIPYESYHPTTFQRPVTGYPSHKRVKEKSSA